MAFFAQCPACRTNRYRIPNRSRGSVARCPQCDKDFVLVPEDEPPPIVRSFGTVRVELGPQFEPRPAATPVRPVERESKSALDVPLILALIAVGLTGTAVVTGHVPYGRFVAVGLAPLGLILAAVSLVGLDRRRWLGWVGVGLNALLLLVLVWLPGWLGIGPWFPRSDPDAGPKPVTAVGRAGHLPVPATWVDASRAEWEQGDLRVAVTAVGIGSSESVPARKKSRVLRIGVRLTNVGVARAIELPAAAGTLPGPTLTDATGKQLYCHGSADAAAGNIYPGKSIDRVYLFDVPPPSGGGLRLEFPPFVLGNTDPVRFRIENPATVGR